MFKKIILSLIIFNSFTLKAFSTDLDKELPRRILETKDLGLYIYIKVVDENNKPLSNVRVKTIDNKTTTDINGEFLLNVKENDELLLSLKGYKDEYLKVSDIKGKIKLYKEPDILEIYPNLTFGLNYKTTNFSEKYQDIISQGNFNNSFEIDTSFKIFNKFLLNLSYNSLMGKIKKPEIVNDFHFHNINFKANYIYKLIDNKLEFLFGINSFFDIRNIDSSNLDDYLDYNNSKIGLGLHINSSLRPIKYFPLIINGFISYFPIISINDPNKFLPNFLQGLDLGTSIRYDWNDIYLQLAYKYSNNYNNLFSSSNNTIKLGIGYGL